MGFTLPHVTVLAATGAVSVALLFQIIGVATPGWLADGKVGYGLWKYCGDSVCINYPESAVLDALKAVRAFGLLGVMAMGVSAGCGLLTCFLINQRQILTLAAPFAALLGAIFSIVEWAVYVGETFVGLRVYLGYSFGLTVTATVLCFVATFLFVLGRNAMRAA